VNRSDTSYSKAVVFTLLALGMATLYWLALSLASHGMLPFAMRPFDFSMEGNSIPGMVLGALLATFGPALAAVITATSIDGRIGLRELWKTVSQWRAPRSVYALVFLGPLAVAALIVVVGYLFHILRFAPENVHPLNFLVLFFLMLVTDGPLGEEIGWRGLLLPALLKRVSPLTASIIVGIVWFLWHIPLRLGAGRDLHALGFSINVIATSIITTWIFIKSRQSTFVAILLHATGNFSLFLVIKSFHHSNDLSGLQMIFNAIIVPLAVVAGIALWRAPAFEASSAR
jgi:membrane protease YdiL (CAAX protease family)